MKRDWSIPRTLAVMAILTTSFGQVTGPTYAAPMGQETLETWGYFELPEPRHVRVEFGGEPGRVSSDLRQPLASREAALADVAGLALDDMVVFDNRSLAGGTDKLNPNSPVAANNGPMITALYNNRQAISLDDGNAWYFFDPASQFAAPAGQPPLDGMHSGLSGDQDVLYDPSRDIMLWLMHTEADLDGNNLQLAVSKGQSSLGSNDWYVYQLLPDGFCSGGPGSVGDWFEEPRLVRTDNYLYIVSDVFRKPDDTDRCSTVIRIPLDVLAAAGGPDYSTGSWYYSTSQFRFAAAQGGTDTLYFAAHMDNDTMRVYRWPESATSASITSYDLDHGSYLTGVTYDCTVFGTAVNPCASLDDRITAGWMRRDINQLGFMWTAPQGNDSKGDKAFPYVRTLVISTATLPLTVADDDYEASADHALFLPSAASNARGHVGGTIASAGGASAAVYPQCSVWLYDNVVGSSWGLGATSEVTAGDGNPSADEWGRYFGTRVSGANPFQFIGTCYAMEGGSATPRVVRFGRERDMWNSNYASFDGNPRSEIAVVRGGAWLWYDLGSASYTGGTWTGAPGGSCTPAPIDYDGDGDKNFSMLCGNAWHFFNDFGSYVKGIWLGSTGIGAVPVPADYNGDGKDDPVVFNAGAWHAYNFTTGLYDAAASKWTGFPGGGGTPAAIDLDGDHVMERSFLSSAGGYYFYSSTGTFLKSIWAGAVAGQLPVPGDYNGDGTDEVFVWRAGAWMNYNFATGLYDASKTVWTGAPAPPIGGGVTLPAPLDYDGDGSMDFTVYSNGPWHFYNDNGSYKKGVWVGAVLGDKPISRRSLP